MPPFRDLTGQRFGRLTAKTYIGSKKKWKCRCDCGRPALVRSNDIVRGKIQSCGCLLRERRGVSSFKHGAGKTAEYRAWQGAKNRCRYSSREGYSRYGGRGIVMCDRWKNSFENFLEDMGKRPSRRHSLDRRNNNGDYEPGNCRWATPKQQANNKTHGRALRKLTDQQVREIKVDLSEATKTLRQIAANYGISKFAIYDIQRGRTWKETHA